MTRKLDRGLWGLNGGIWAVMNMGGCVYEYEVALYVNVIYYPSVPTLCIRGIPGNPRTRGNAGRLPEICLESVLGYLVRRIPISVSRMASGCEPRGYDQQAGKINDALHAPLTYKRSWMPSTAFMTLRTYKPVSQVWVTQDTDIHLSLLLQDLDVSCAFKALGDS
jgi:hypothetical protein